MSATLSLTEEQTLAALRAFLLALLPDGVEVVVGQDNRVAEPTSSDFVVMTPMGQGRLSTNVVTYDDGLLEDPINGIGKRFDTVPARVSVQLDVHGPDSFNNAAVIAAMFRSDYAVDQLATSELDIAPLYAGEPHQSPFSNGEQQTEQCWIVDVTLQCNPVITTGQDFADELAIGIHSVEREFPPT